MRLAVAGGTGVVGRHVVEVARGRGHDVVVLARSAGVDLVAGTGPDPTGTGSARLDLAGVVAVVDVTSTQTTSARASRDFFGAVTGHLVEAEERAGVGHHVALSIVGVDRAPHGYYAGKALQERLVTAAPVPWTLLRATQFHEFASQVHGQVALGPVVVVPRMRSQPVAAREVAEALVDLAEAPAASRVPDLGGPEELRMADMVRAWAAAVGDTRRVVEVPLPGGFGRALRDGTLLLGPGGRRGSTTYDAWVAGVRSAD